MIHRNAFSLQTSLVDTIFPDSATTGSSSRALSRSAWNLRNLVLIVAGVLILTLSSKVQIPFWPFRSTAGIAGSARPLWLC